jgi:hypothetical protein
MSDKVLLQKENIVRIGCGQWLDRTGGRGCGVTIERQRVPVAYTDNEVSASQSQLPSIMSDEEIIENTEYFVEIRTRGSEDRVKFRGDKKGRDEYFEKLKKILPEMIELDT